MPRVSAILGGLLLVACAPQPSSSSSPILNGVDDSPELYPGVVRLTTGSQSCSGTLVAADGTSGWVLTAGHCLGSSVALPGASPAVTEWQVQVGAQVATATSFPVVAAHVHPALDRDRNGFPDNLDVWPTGRANDVALLQVTDLTPEVAALAIPWLEAADDDLDVGSSGDIVGYGRTSASGSGAAVRQRATVSLHGIYSSYRLDSEFLVLDARDSNPGFCLGDSGGPLLVTSGSGEVAVAGVISSNYTAGYSQCRGFGVLPRVSPLVADFLQPVLAGAPPAPTACYACAFQATQPDAACADELAAAQADASDFVDCLGNDPIESCRTNDPGGAAAYDAYWSCLETVACPGLCGDAYQATAECRFALDGGGVCDGCLHDSCCAETAACRRSSACSACLSVVGTDAATCGVLYPEVLSCLQGSCAEPCGALLDSLPPVTDAGVPDAAGAPDAGTVDAGAPDAGAHGDGDDGCGCRAAGGRPAGGRAPSGARVLLVAGLLLVGGRGRRRRRG